MLEGLHVIQGIGILIQCLYLYIMILLIASKGCLKYFVYTCSDISSVL